MKVRVTAADGTAEIAACQRAMLKDEMIKILHHVKSGTESPHKLCGVNYTTKKALISDDILNRQFTVSNNFQTGTQQESNYHDTAHGPSHYRTHCKHLKI